MGGSARVAKAPPKIIDPTRGYQLSQAPSMWLPEQRPSIDDAVVLQDSGPGAIACVVGQQPHTPQPSLSR